MSDRGVTRTDLRVKVDDNEATERAATRREDPDVKAWLRRARKLMGDMPAGTRIYWQEDTLNLMALSPEGWMYINEHGAGEAQAAIVATIHVPGSDCGGW